MTRKATKEEKAVLQYAIGKIKDLKQLPPHKRDAAQALKDAAEDAWTRDPGNLWKDSK